MNQYKEDTQTKSDGDLIHVRKAYSSKFTVPGKLIIHAKQTIETAQTLARLVTWCDLS